MNTETFLDLLKNAAHKDLRGKPYEIFSDIIRSQGRSEYGQGELPGCIETMERIRISIGQSPSQDSTTQLKITDQDILTSNFLNEIITPQIELLRMKLFKKKTPPFDPKEAAEWIENEALKEAEPAEGLWSEVVGLSEKLRKRFIELSTTWRTLPYIKENNEWLQRAPVKTTEISLFEFETRKIAKATGFPQHALVMCVLTGIKPLIPRVTISSVDDFHPISDFDQLHRKEVILRINARDLTFRELQNVYYSVKKDLTIKKGKKLNYKHLQVYTHIKKLGQPPEAGSPDGRHINFYRQAKNKWNQMHPENPFNSWQAIRSAYESTIAKLENLYY